MLFLNEKNSNQLSWMEDMPYGNGTLIRAVCTSRNDYMSAYSVRVLPPLLKLKDLTVGQD